MNNKFEFEIVCEFGALSERTKSGWRKELNVVSYNGKAPKYDIRDWNEDHTKMGKGVTLTEEEFENLKKVLIG